MGGLLGDYFEKKNKMAKAFVAIFGAIVAIPLIAGCCAFKSTNFYVSMAFLALEFMVSEGWMAPTMTMMQRTVKPKAQGSIVSAYLFFLTLGGMSSSILLGFLANLLKCKENPLMYGKLVFYGSVGGYLCSIPAFWMAGRSYKKYLKNNTNE